ncbi:hypothetical protein [Rubritalea tangerina]|uniref:hypothetical protein n=1 Tax=Rubritalea tangerina TaxID=430798 RepID=UPI003613B802
MRAQHHAGLPCVIGYLCWATEVLTSTGWKNLGNLSQIVSSLSLEGEGGLLNLLESEVEHEFGACFSVFR